MSHWVSVRGAQVTWGALLEAVERYVETCPPGELCEWDVDRLRAAARAVTLRLGEAREREGGGGPGHPTRPVGA